MRKAKLSLLAAAIFAGTAGTSMAAERAGFGLEWSVGPTIAFASGFDMQMDQTFGVEFMINDDFSAGLFGGTGRWAGEYAYTNDITVPGQSFDQRIQKGGSTEVNGLRLSYTLPFMRMLKLGFELGRVSFGEDSVTYYNSDGSYGGAGDFGGTVESLDTVAAMEGISVRANLLNGAAGALTASVGVQASLRFAQFERTAVFGSQESTVDPALHPVMNEIETITSYNTLSVAAALNVGF
jgi:hypothetical protein